MAATRATHRALSASTVVQLALTTYVERIRVVNVTGTAAIYFRVDGTDPTVLGDDCYVLAAVAGDYLEVGVEANALPTVKLISSGTPTVGVMTLQ